MRFTRPPMDFDTEGFADETEETPVQAHCACGRFLPRYTSMPRCKACLDTSTAKLKTDIERQIEKMKGSWADVLVLSAEIKRRRAA